MTLQEIKEAIKGGKIVNWTNNLYEVIKDKNGMYLIYCSSNGYCVGLTHKDGITMNGKEEDFYILGNK